MGQGATSDATERGAAHGGLVWVIGVLLAVVLASPAVAAPRAAEPAHPLTGGAGRDPALDAALSASMRRLGIADAAEGDRAVPDCDGGPCLAGLLRGFGADYAVRVTPVTAGGRERDAVEVVLIEPGGQRFAGWGSCPRGEWTTCVAAALRDARGLRLLGPGPWLQVEGDPAGAAVWVDGMLVGQVPYRGRIAVGARRVEIRAPGHGAQRYQLQVPALPGGATRPVRLEVALPVEGLGRVAAAPRAAPGADTSTVPDLAVAPAPRAHVVGPLVLGVIGVGMAAYAVAALVARGDCGDDCGDTPSAALGVTLLGGGAAAVVGAALWYELERHDDGPVGLRVSPFGLHGRF